MKYYKIVGLGVLSLAWFASCDSGAKTMEQTVSKKEGFCLDSTWRQQVGIAKVIKKPITEQMLLSGKIEYNENDMVAFRSLLEGTVDQVQFELGDYVRKGQVLATIRSAQIQELYQEKRNQENQIELLQAQVKSKQEMLEDGLSSAPELIQLRHELEQANIQRDRVMESLALYRSAGANAFQILAPKDGYIIQKSISAGQNVVSDSEPLFAVSNLKQVWVMVNVFASNLKYIQEGAAVKVRTIAFPDQLHLGKVDKIYNVFDDSEHVLKARVVLDNPKLNLMPGLSADIIIDKKSVSGEAYAIPNEALVFHNNKDYIVLYGDDCNLKVIGITALARNEEYTFIKEELNDSARVLTTNALLVFEELNK